MAARGSASDDGRQRRASVFDARRRGARRSPTACRISCSTRCASPTPSRTASTAAAAPDPARRSGSSASSRRSDAATADRLAPLGQLRPSLRARARVGGGAHRLAVAGPLAVDELPQPPRADRPSATAPLVLMLAAAELLVRGGERVALLGLTPPTASRKATTRIAEAIAAHRGDAGAAGEPAAARRACRRFSSAILFSDFLDPPDEIARARSNELAADGVTRPPHPGARSGRGDAALRGPHGVPSARRRRALGRRPRREPARRLPGRSSPRIAPSSRRPPRRLGWSFLVHHTDRPAAEPLLTLIMRLQGDGRRLSLARPDAATRTGGAP